MCLDRAVLWRQRHARAVLRAKRGTQIVDKARKKVRIELVRWIRPFKKKGDAPPWRETLVKRTPRAMRVALRVRTTLGHLLQR